MYLICFPKKKRLEMIVGLLFKNLISREVKFNFDRFKYFLFYLDLKLNLFIVNLFYNNLYFFIFINLW